MTSRGVVTVLVVVASLAWSAPARADDAVPDGSGPDKVVTDDTYDTDVSDDTETVPPELMPDPVTGEWPESAPRWLHPPELDLHADSSGERALSALDNHTTPISPNPSPDASLAGLQSLPPTRVLDTRSGLGAVGPVGGGQTVELAMLGVGGVPPGNVGAVVLNVTVTEPTTATFITAWPTGEPRPNASILNAAVGQTLPNLAIVKLGVGGRVSIFNNDGAAHLVVDVVGWAPSDLHFTAMSPVRLLDTRESASPLGPAMSTDVQIAGRGGVPATGVGAVVVNLTATEPTAPSHVTAWPAGEPIPVASTLNVDPGETFPNLAVLKLGAGGAISLYNNAGSTHLVLDVMGWMPPEGGFVALSPRRVLDTRSGVGAPAGPVFGGAVAVIDLSAEVDPDVDGVFLNVTAVTPTAPTHITAYPTGGSPPTASNVNPVAGEIVPNLVFVPLSDASQVSLYNNAGATHLVADLVGLSTRRSAQDDPDAGSSVVVHPIYVRPAGVAAPAGRLDAIAHELANMDAWLASQAPGHQFEWDRSGGQIEISEAVIGQSLSQLYGAGPSFGGGSGSLLGIDGVLLIEAQLAADGFGHPDKVYVLFIESVFTGFVCGVVLGEASNDVALEGPIGVARYAHSFIASSCDDPSTTSSPGVSETATTATHEFFHALGAVPLCGTTDNGAGHVNTSGAPGTDLMGRFVVLNPSLDPGRDDYWGHGRTTCPDLERSPYL